MRKIFLTLLFTTVTANMIAGQISRKDPPTIVNSPTSAKKAPSALPELVGLTGQKAPGFTTANMCGTEYNLEALRGKVVVINLWGTFCPPCIDEMPKLNALVKKYKSTDVVFLAPTPDDKTLLEGFLQKHPFDYQVLPGSFGIIEQYAPKKKASSPTDKPGGFIMLLPTHLVIDREGTVIKHFWGYQETTVDELSKTIEQLLAVKN